MKKVLPSILSLFALLWSVCATAEGDAAAGEAKTIVCSACHGPTGASISNLYPNLAGQGEKYLLKQMRDIKSEARPVLEMTGMLVAMSDQDLEDIAAFYAAQDKKIIGSQELEDEAYGLSAEEFLALGENLYRGGNLDTNVPACTGCHSPRGSGNAPAAYPAIGGQYSEYIFKQLSDFQRNLRTNDGDTLIMRGVAGPMSDLEMRAVANYAAGLN